MYAREMFLYICAILYLLSLHSSYGLNLQVYQTAQFTNPVSSSEFTKFTRHNETGTIYIGASDALFQLGSDFVRTQSVDTSIGECEDNVVSCPNYNKILVIDYTNNRLITCGSESYHEGAVGTCNLRDINDISTVLHADNNNVVPPGLLTTEAIIAPGPNSEYLYVATTYHERNGNPYLISRRLLMGGASENLAANHYTSLATSNINYVRLTIDFIYTFLIDDYSYFVTHQRQEESEDFTSKISRVCHGDSNNNLNSFTEITLECQGQNGIIYNLIQAAHVGPAGPDLATSMGISNGTDVFYGVFAKSEGAVGSVPSMQSALCIYKLDDIKASLFEAVAGCFGRNSGNNPEIADRHQVNYLSGINDNSCRGLDVSKLLIVIFKIKNLHMITSSSHNDTHFS